MKTSQFFISTQKESPAEAEIVSHRLMLRAGLIRRLSAGIYSFLPLGMRVVRKVETIVREEMNRAGALEMIMPVVQPAELWQESQRWQEYGPELLRFKDRHERDFVIQPTSEEAITEFARAELRSYRRLPVHFYQIQTKFRDERRPRFGIMRGREFVMKDGYSFHADYEDLKREYRNMHDTYTRIFTRLGLKFRDVAADTGAIGHSFADGGLLQQALTHRSHGPEHNERLEFLGDGVLGCAIADELYARFPQLPEGKLTQLRAGHERPRPEVDARVVQRVQGGGDALSRLALCAGRHRAHALPGQRARLERSARGALLHEARRLPGRGQPGAVRDSALPAGAGDRGSGVRAGARLRPPRHERPARQRGP